MPVQQLPGAPDLRWVTFNRIFSKKFVSHREAAISTCFSLYYLLHLAQLWVP